MVFLIVIHDSFELSEGLNKFVQTRVFKKGAASIAIYNMFKHFVFL